MNYTISPEDERIYIDIKQSGLTDLGIFISSLLLSVSGLLAVLCSSLRKSNCSSIKCGSCCQLERGNLNISD
jgi:hypothetical protein